MCISLSDKCSARPTSDALFSDISPSIACFLSSISEKLTERIFCEYHIMSIHRNVDNVDNYVNNTKSIENTGVVIHTDYAHWF